MKNMNGSAKSSTTSKTTTSTKTSTKATSTKTSTKATNTAINEKCQISELIGNTKLILIKSLSKLSNCEIYAKMESMNIAGSSKDRIALGTAYMLCLCPYSVYVVSAYLVFSMMSHNYMSLCLITICITMCLY